MPAVVHSPPQGPIAPVQALKARSVEGFIAAVTSSDIIIHSGFSMTGGATFVLFSPKKTPHRLRIVYRTECVGVLRPSTVQQSVLVNFFCKRRRRIGIGRVVLVDKAQRQKITLSAAVGYDRCRSRQHRRKTPISERVDSGGGRGGGMLEPRACSGCISAVVRHREGAESTHA